MSNLSPAANPERRWTRFWRFLSQFDEALSVREVDILQRRVGWLEEQVAELRSKIADSAAGATTVADDRKSH
jgi:hypothetical protein